MYYVKMSIHVDDNYYEVAHILANMSDFIKTKYTIIDLKNAEKELNDTTINYEITKHLIKIVINKFGLNSTNHQHAVSECLKYSNMKDQSKYKYETIKKSLNF